VEAGLRDQVLWRLLVATALIHLLFAIWPSVDIWASRLFVQADGSFWLSKNVLAEEVRMPIWFASVALAALAAAMLGFSLLHGATARMPWRLWAFITCLYVIGPGLLVNVLLKQNWGRARPVMVEAFGGDKLFTPPFEIAGQCSNNCSFVSGEAASAAVMVIVLAVFFANVGPRQWRRVVFVALGALFVIASGMRVASGRHFLSDVVFAGLFMLIIARALHLAFAVRPVHFKALLGAMRADVTGIFRPVLALAGTRPRDLQTVEVALPLQQKNDSGSVV
jgi:lipid A 4'-phosphatase